MVEHSFITYNWSQVGAGAAFPASNGSSGNLEGKSFSLNETQVADTTEMVINDVDGDGMFDDQDPNGQSGQTYDANEQMVSFDGNTSSTYAGADWNTYAKYTVTGSDGSTFEVHLIARADAGEPRWSVKPDGTVGSEHEHYYYAFTEPLKPGVTYTYSTWDQKGQVGWDSLVAICFTTGTSIETVNGPVAVENLKVGDQVLTADNGAQEIRWIGCRRLNGFALSKAPKLLPVRIKAGALGDGKPETDLVVSPQHRILVKSVIAQRMFDCDEVLVPAKQLLLVDGIDIEAESSSVEYFHILFDDHQVIFSNGTPTESMYTGPEAIKTIAPAAREELFELFPELTEVDYRAASARLLVSNRLSRKLVHRHVQNGKPLMTNTNVM